MMEKIHSKDTAIRGIDREYTGTWRWSDHQETAVELSHRQWSSTRWDSLLQRCWASNRN